MRRALVICLIGATAAGGASAVAVAAEAPRATLENPICHRASNPLDRAVAITAVMRPLNGTERMEVQFSLLEKPRGARAYSEVSGGDLGKWVSPPDLTLGQRPTDVWRRQKQVFNLAGPAAYRFHVGFRWIGAHGHSLGRQYRWGEPCEQG
jgi:hypothetical protein